MAIITPEIIKANHKGFYFDPSWMQIFGDTMENFGAREVETKSHGRMYQLYRKQPTHPSGLPLKAPMGDYKQSLVMLKPLFPTFDGAAYFDPETFDQITDVELYPNPDGGV